jgi:hypothetical protein
LLALPPTYQIKQHGNTMEILSRYNDLTDEQLIKIGIDFVARGVDMPIPIRDQLLRLGLYEAIINPRGE